MEGGKVKLKTSVVGVGENPIVGENSCWPSLHEIKYWEIKCRKLKLKSDFDHGFELILDRFKKFNLGGKGEGLLSPLIGIGA